MRSFFAQLWQNWREIATCIGDFQARLLLTTFYFSVLVPFGLPVRLFSDPLRLRRPSTKSAWLPRESQDADLSIAGRLY